MFERAGRPRLFGLPCGADFPSELVRGLVARTRGTDPEAMARVTLYLNTGRMLRAVRAAFDRHGARILPRLRLVTDLALAPAPDLPLPVPPLHRRLELMRLVAALVDWPPEVAAGQAWPPGTLGALVCPGDQPGGTVVGRRPARGVQGGGCW
jgi:ATP-dependent helicase/nuclease subunit B